MIKKMRTTNHLKKKNDNLIPNPVPVINDEENASENNAETQNDKRPEVQWWMYALCVFFLLGLLFIFDVRHKQELYDKEHKKINNEETEELETEPEKQRE